MNSAVRAVVRMGIYVGCRVFLIKEVRSSFIHKISTFVILSQIIKRSSDFLNVYHHDYLILGLL